MFREEQVDLRRQRARDSQLTIERVGKEKYFTEYRVTNPQTKGEYKVELRGFAVGDNTCTCPDFKANTLGTCKHIEAVIEQVKQHAPKTLTGRKAIITRPIIELDYSSEQLRLKLRLPERHSDLVRQFAIQFFNPDHFWNGQNSYHELIGAIKEVPEKIILDAEAESFISREIEHQELARREKELLAELHKPETPLRHLVKIPLFDYQIIGAIFLACQGRAILADDMGLGKTAQTLAAIELLDRERGLLRVLIVAPASVKYQWQGEIQKFTDRSVRVIEGLKEERTEQFAANDFFKLVNYEQVIQDLDLINDWKPDVIVLDEAQRIKNWQTKTSQAVKKLESRYAIVLSGTPLENKVEELYSIVQFVDARRLGTAFAFMREHQVLDSNNQRVIGYRKIEKLREKLKPVMLRRTRNEVLSELPARTESIRYVEFHEAQRVPYDQERSQLARLLAKPALNEGDRKKILAALANMRLICDSLFLFDKKTHLSPKLDEFAQLISDLLATEDHKIVVFSEWKIMLDEAERVLKQLNARYVLFHGKLSSKDRREVLEEFKKPDCQVFLSTDAGGEGLNLQMADTVINLELPWNPAVLAQRVARVHRMGQKRPVSIVNFITRHSIEERVAQVHRDKLAIFETIFSGDSDTIDLEGNNSAIAIDTIRNLLADDPLPTPVPLSSAKGPAALLEAGILMLEALHHWEGPLPWSDDLRDRAIKAMQGLLERGE
jgi:SNF2 family DNA or RNA helicase